MSEFATFHDLENACVFITGGGSGIGAALTEGFLLQGARVGFVDLLDCGELVESLQQRCGSRAYFEQCDISDIDALKSAMDAFVVANGAITVLVNNAANDTRHSLENTDPEDWDRCQNINLRPHFFTAQAVAESMKDRGSGAIINFSSISYLMGNAGYPGYVAAKAAITGLTRALARELGPDGIRVNALLPGWVLTDRQLELWANPEALAEHLQRQCLPRHLQPEDIVDSVLFLASNASRMITGQALVVDGGVVVSG